MSFADDVALATRAGIRGADVVRTQPTATARPFIRCMGGKWRLREQLDAFLPRRSTYVEPFVGGGAMFFHVHATRRPSRVVLNDVDTSLVHLYSEVRDRPRELHAEADALMRRYVEAPEATYYALRDEWNRRLRSPALNLTLRATCFNGLWRENADGKMNSPWRRDAKNNLVTLERLLACSAALAGVGLLGASFEDVMEQAKGDTVVYCDPPYVDAETKYAAGGFSLDRFIDLLKACAAAEERGCFVVMSNHDRPVVRDLTAVYWPSAVVGSIMAPRSINSDGTRRQKVPEVVIHSPR